MKKSKNKLWEILVPRCSNEGLEHSVEYHQEWDKTVRKISGGITILKTAKGHWLNPDGMLFVEEMIPVRIYCTEKTIDKIMNHTISYYNQEAIFAYEISSNVKVKHKK